jgi:predicted nucleic acid-binding protein
MKVAFDTSVLVPALVPALPGHAAAYAWISAAADGRIDGIMSWHAFAEAWAVLTRIPNIRPAPTPGTARDSLMSLEKIIRRRPVDARTYEAAVDLCVDKGLRSGAIFDALHLICARREQADGFVTGNLRDFQRLAGDADPRIVSTETSVEAFVESSVESLLAKPRGRKPRR